MYTGYFGKIKTYKKAGLIPVSICGKAPEIKKRLFDKDGNLMQLTTLNSEPKYDRYFDYYSITISNSDGHWVEGHLESKDLNEVLEGCKKLNVIFLKEKK